MKWIKRLDEKLKDHKGKVVDGEETMADVLTFILYRTKVNEAEDVLRVNNKLIPMVSASKKALELEDNDYELVKGIVEKNELQMMVGHFGQILMIFEDEKEVKKDAVQNKDKTK